MKEICVPIPEIADNEIAEVIVNIKGRSIKYNYRVESFPWEPDNALSVYGDIPSISSARINELRKSIKNYDKNWELVQIYNPSENAHYIHVLYRRKKP